MGYFYVVLLLIFDVFFDRVEMEYILLRSMENRVQRENEDMLPDS